jgi:hypothetical protein
MAQAASSRDAHHVHADSDDTDEEKQTSSGGMRRGGSGLGLGGAGGDGGAGGGAFKVAPGRSSPNDLESPLISPGQGHEDAAEGEKGSGSRKGSRSSRGPQRHIRIENGEFVLGRVERARILARRGIIEKCLGKTEVTRDDVYRNNEVISSRYTLLNFLPKNLYEQLGQNTRSNHHALFPLATLVSSHAHLLLCHVFLLSLLCFAPVSSSPQGCQLFLLDRCGVASDSRDQYHWRPSVHLAASRVRADCHGHQGRHGRLHATQTR